MIMKNKPINLTKKQERELAELQDFATENRRTVMIIAHQNLIAGIRYSLTRTLNLKNKNDT